MFSRYITYDDSHADPYSPPIIILPLVDEARNMGDNIDFNIKGIHINFFMKSLEIRKSKINVKKFKILLLSINKKN